MDKRAAFAIAVLTLCGCSRLGLYTKKDLVAVYRYGRIAGYSECLETISGSQDHTGNPGEPLKTRNPGKP